MDYPFCEKNHCVNFKEGHCTLKNPEKDEKSCLHYEDTMDSLRLKADVLKGTLKKE